MRPHTRTCCPHPSRSQLATRNTVEPPIPLGLGVFYWVLVPTEPSASVTAEDVTNLNNLGSAQLQAQHTSTANDFLGLNADLALLPDSGPYASAKQLQASSQITLLWRGFTKVSVPPDDYEFLLADENAWATRAAAQVGGQPEMANVYITVAPASGNLGQVASIPAAFCVVNYRTVGGPGLPGLLPGFDLGRTLTHELGHCFGLLHPWEATLNCDVQYLDLPRSHCANFQGVLAGGARWDHRWWQNGDEPLVGPDALCQAEFGSQEACPNTTDYEFFMNFMEYCEDANLNMFTAGQAGVMNEFLRTSPFGWQVDGAPGPSEENDSGGGLSTGAIIGIAVGGAVLLVAIGLMAHYLPRLTSSTNTPT